MACTVQQKEAFKEEKLAEAFRAFDKDNSGKISIHEIFDILNVSDKDEKKKIEEIVNKYDLNKDGEIDQDEFINMMSKVDI